MEKFYILSKEKGYSPSQQKHAMQLMEVHPESITVKCKGGCMTKLNDHFQPIVDLSGRIIHRFPTAK